MRRSLLAFITLLLVSSIAYPALASPQPEPVCGACGGGFELAIERQDVEATVVESTAVVRVHEDGSATWSIRNRLANESTAETLRNRPDALLAALEYANRRSVVEGPFENASARVENRTVVLSFEDRYATTEMPGGVHVLDYVHSGGAENWHVLTADRLTVIGPSGTEVTNDPAGATVSGRKAAWDGNGSAAMWDAPRVQQDTYVVFAEPGATATVLTPVAIALATLPTVVDVLTAFHLPVTVLFGLMFAGVGVGTKSLAHRVEGRQRGVAGLVGLGIVAAAAVVVSSRGWFWWAAGFTTVSAAMGGIALARGRRVSPGQLVAAGVLALAATGLVAAFAGSVASLADTLRSLPLVLAPAFGGALAAGNRGRAALVWILGLASFFLAVLAAISPTQQPFGAVIFLLAIYAVAVALATFPLALLGAATEPGEPSGKRERGTTGPGYSEAH